MREVIFLPNAKKKVPDPPLHHFLAPLGPVVVRANVNLVTKGCGRHVSVCEPFVLSMTPTTNPCHHHLLPLKWMLSTTPNTSVHF